MKNMQAKADNKGPCARRGSILAGILATLFGTVFLLTLPGCQNPLAQRTDRATGALSLTIGDLVVGRTILPTTPDLENFFERFELDLVHTTDSAQNSMNISWDGERIDGIATGTWNLTLRAFRDAEDTVPMATGTLANFEVRADVNNATIHLIPHPGGQGTLSLNIGNVSSNVYAITVRIFEFDGHWEDVEAAIDADAFCHALDLTLAGRTATGTILGVSSGEYLVLFSLTSNATPPETFVLDGGILRIYRGLTSTFTDPFDAFANIQFPGNLLAAMAAAWNGTEFAGMTINAAHFTRALSIQGVGANLHGVLGRFAYRYPDANADDFPTGIVAFRDLVDVSLIDLGIAATGFNLTATHPLGREAALNAVLDLAENVPRITVGATWADESADWVETGDTLNLMIGAYSVPIRFYGELAERFEITLNAPSVDNIPAMGLAFAATYQYTVRPDAITVTVRNTGNMPTDDLTVSVTSTAFELSPTTIGSLVEYEDHDVFTVQPVLDLGVGHHMATVRVRGVYYDGKYLIDVSFPVNFTVSYAPANPFVITGEGVAAGAVTIDAGSYVDLSVVITPANADQSVTWTIESQNNVVTLDTPTNTPTIRVTAGAVAGTAVVRATTGDGMYAEVMVTVTKPNIPGTEITFKWDLISDLPDNITVESGNVRITYTLNISNLPDGATVRWLVGMGIVGTETTLPVRNLGTGLGVRFVTAVITYDGVEFNRLIRLYVTP